MVTEPISRKVGFKDGMEILRSFEHCHRGLDASAPADLGLLGLGSDFAEVLNLDQFLFQRVAALPPGVKTS